MCAKKNANSYAVHFGNSEILTSNAVGIQSILLSKDEIRVIYVGTLF